MTDVLRDELKNFEAIAQAMNPKPQDIPTLDGIDIYGEVVPLNGIVGGDHLIYVDFSKRYDLDARIRSAEEAGDARIAEGLRSCKSKAGIVVMDVSGHQTTDAMLAGMVHQAFLMGALYELDMFGQITNKLFENLNTRLYRSSLISKFVTAIYTEISADAHFRFLSAAHPVPMVFSKENDRFTDFSPEHLTTFPPLGTIPSETDIDRAATKSLMGLKGSYEMNQMEPMRSGDIMFLLSDGITDHVHDNVQYFPDRLEGVVRKTKYSRASEIANAIMADVRAFGAPQDDITLVVIKRD